MKPNPSVSIECSTVSGDISRFNPNDSNTSALPQRLVNERLPCLATATPEAAITRALVVLTLNVPAPSPPVPQVSNRYPFNFALILRLQSRITSTIAETSLTDSPFFFNPNRH